jgi:hypothetical protein
MVLKSGTQVLNRLGAGIEAVFTHALKKNRVAGQPPSGQSRLFEER